MGSSEKPNQVIKLDDPCPKCKQETLVCEYWEDGSAKSFIDNFRLRCTNPKCDFKEEKLSVYGGQADGMGPYDSPPVHCFFVEETLIKSRPKSGLFY